MRKSILHPQLEELKVTDEQRQKFDSWLAAELMDAKAARTALEALWRELVRQYDAVPRTPFRNTPIENASNVEIPLGAIAVDSIYAQMIDLIYTISQPITIRHKHKDFVQRAKAMQAWVDLLVHEINLRPASEHSIFDTAQLGTGFYYTPFVESFVKNKTHKVVRRGPQIISMLPDDVLMWGGVFNDVQDCRGLSLRFYLTLDDLHTAAKHRKWDITHAKPCAAGDWIRQRRERLSRVNGDLQRNNDIYEVHDIYVRYDIDEDGYDEDLLVNFDATSQCSLRLRYAPYDERPVSKMCYQIRSHMPYGIGVMEMISPLQNVTTDLHNHQVDNVAMANMRMFKSRYGAVKGGTINIWSGRNLEMANPEDLMEMKLSDIYPSLERTQGQVTQLAERRTGANELTQPNQNQTFGNRTPAATATSLLQQANRRFTPAFDAVRLGTAGAVRQAILRVAERIRAGDLDYEQHLLRTLGETNAAQVIDCLKDEFFDHSIGIHVTASSNAINKDADRQNAVTLANLLAPYYEKMLQLVTTVSNPMAPPEVRSTALKIAAATSELIDRIIRTFEQFKDPEIFVVDPSDEIEQAQESADAQNMMQLAVMSGMMGGEGGMGGGEGMPGQAGAGPNTTAPTSPMPDATQV